MNLQAPVYLSNLERLCRVVSLSLSLSLSLSPRLSVCMRVCACGTSTTSQYLDLKLVLLLLAGATVSGIAYFLSPQGMARFCNHENGHDMSWQSILLPFIMWIHMESCMYLLSFQLLRKLFSCDAPGDFQMRFRLSFMLHRPAFS